MQFVLTINCDNDAFQPTPEYELSGLLTKVANRISNGAGADQTILDANGTTVGSCSLTEDR